jgi:transcriptional regulator with XRE-family HTH domain
MPVRHDRPVDDLAVGRLLRLARSRRRLRQADVARIAGIHQGTVSLAERGQLSALTVRTTRAIAAALQIGLQFEPRWRGPALDRLRDAGHAAAVEAVAAELARHGWDVLIEVGFSRYGERGSVDVIGWRATECALLIVEVKTSLVDLQATLGAIDRKRRIVPGELSRERGWRPAAIGVALVVVDSSTARDVVTRHRSIFDSAFPSRTVAVRHWLESPTGALRGLWFLRPTHRVRTTGRIESSPALPGASRVRPRRS